MKLFSFCAKIAKITDFCFVIEDVFSTWTILTSVNSDIY